MEKYFLIEPTEDGPRVHVCTKEALSELLKELEIKPEHVFTRDNFDPDTNYWCGWILIIKGDFAKIGVKNVVKEYDIK